MKIKFFMSWQGNKQAYAGWQDIRERWNPLSSDNDDLQKRKKLDERIFSSA